MVSVILVMAAIMVVVVAVGCVGMSVFAHPEARDGDAV